VKAGRRALIAAAAAAAAVTTTAPASAISRTTAARSVKAPRQRLVSMRHSAFPYEGTVPDTGLPFLDATQDGLIGHQSARGGFYAAQTTYSDRRSLLHVGAGYRGSTRSLAIVFFHGNGATLSRDVVLRQRVAEQFDASGIDGVLIAPQLAVDAWDSSAGHFWSSRFAPRYLDEAFSHLAPMSGRPLKALQGSRVVLVAYSGGYLPLSYCLADESLGKRLAGVVLLDALYGEQARFEQWIAAHHRRAFFVSAWSNSSLSENVAFNLALASRDISLQTGAPQRLSGGGVWTVPALDTEHADFVTRAWVDAPLRDLLSRMR
jgi:hypothetical protein